MRLHIGITSAGASSSAPSAGAAAATAEAPQIELSTAIRQDKVASRPSLRPSQVMNVSPKPMTLMSISRIFRPAWRTRSRFSRTPSRTMPSRSRLFAENPIPIRCPNGTPNQPEQQRGGQRADVFQHRQPAQTESQHRQQYRHADPGAEMSVSKCHAPGLPPRPDFRKYPILMADKIRLCRWGEATSLTSVTSLRSLGFPFAAVEIPTSTR